MSRIPTTVFESTTCQWAVYEQQPEFCYSPMAHALLRQGRACARAARSGLMARSIDPADSLSFQGWSGRSASYRQVAEFVIDHEPQRVGRRSLRVDAPNRVHTYASVRCGRAIRHQ